MKETTMPARFDLRNASPGGYAAMLGLNAQVHASGLDAGMLELIKIRVSQLNGCAFCIAMHVAAARKLGVGEQRMHLLAAWHEAPIYSAAERAALAWAEVLTRLPGGEVTDEAYEQASTHFPGAQIVELSLAVVEINAWNRLMMAARVPPTVDRTPGS
ncbi:MAG: carboxymuconolactone decarboxylase family protein [Sulfuritalea sp.]|nr:carboxymuconolactone decarboxylase family protein [Sulfuritalea sp.]